MLFPTAIALAATVVNCDDARVVVASIDETSIPVRLGPSYGEALAAVGRFDLARRRVGGCDEGHASCVANLLVDAWPEKKRCRLTFDRPRDREVFVLGDVEAYVSIEGLTDDKWHRVGRYRDDDLFIDAFVLEGDALKNASISGWLRVDDDGLFVLRLTPPNRRPNGGGSSVFPVRGVLRIAVAAYDQRFCHDWIEGAVDIVYRPFAEPDPPRTALDSATLKERRRSNSSCAYATLLYDDGQGYVHGALALFQSIIDFEGRCNMVALLGEGVGKIARGALGALGVDLIDLGPLNLTIPEASSALPGLGRGQWSKLELWRLPYDRVLYLDADAVLLRNVDEVFSTALDDDQTTLGAVNDYFAGAVLLVKPDEATYRSFEATLRRDGGRYVYGEQDFFNAHFAGSHALLGPEYHCLAEATAQTLLALDPSEDLTARLRHLCGILEFSSCARDAGTAWKPWHGRQNLNPDHRICLHHPNTAVHHLLDLWEHSHLRALTALLAANVERPPLLRGIK